MRNQQQPMKKQWPPHRERERPKWARGEIKKKREEDFKTTAAVDGSERRGRERPRQRERERESETRSIGYKASVR